MSSDKMLAVEERFLYYKQLYKINTLIQSYRLKQVEATAEHSTAIKINAISEAYNYTSYIGHRLA